MGTAIGPTMRMVSKREQRGHIAVCHEPDVAALTAVSTIGTTARHKLLATEGNTARSAISPTNVQTTLIDKPRHDLTE